MKIDAVAGLAFNYGDGVDGAPSLFALTTTQLGTGPSGLDAAQGTVHTITVIFGHCAAHHPEPVEE
jgi:hypothetical protein